MRCAIVLLVVTSALLGRPAGASQERIHDWTRVVVAADAGSFGRVDVSAAGTRGEAPRVRSVAVRTGAATLAVPRELLRSLPALRLSSLQIRSEPGYDAEPWLYVVFETTASGTAADVRQQLVHFAIRDGALRHVSIRTRDGSGATEFERRDVP